MGKIFTKEYEINFYKTDYRLKCSIESIINFISDIGIEQPEKLGCGMEYLKEKNMSWVFFQYDIKVNRYPNYGEKITIVTEPTGIYKCFSFRSYDIYDKDGEKIVEAKAVSCLIDTRIRKALRVPLEQYKYYGIEDEIKECSIERLDEIEEAMSIKEFDVRYSDIDFNKHVNNAKYVQWSIESTPLDIVKEYEIKRVSVDFEKECNYGDEIKVITSVKEIDNENIEIMYNIKNSSGKLLTKLLTKWKKINVSNKIAV